MWKWHKSNIIKIEDESPTTKRFRLEVPDLEKVDFKAGQFITMDLPIHKKRLKRWRSYSIANAPDGTNIIELCIVYLEGGLASEYLFKETKVGDEITFKGPTGVFTLPQELDNDIVLICTGTGIAPFRSMIWDIYNNKKTHQKIHLIFGTRYEKNILYRQELEELEKQWSDFYYTVTLARERNWAGFQGYVHAVYEKLYQQHDNTVFYLCGWQNMIDEAKERLQKMGVEKERIVYELYG